MNDDEVILRTHVATNWPTICQIMSPAVFVLLLLDSQNRTEGSVCSNIKELFIRIL